jgi:hypothetical protein
MVLHLAADAAQLMHNGDADLREMLGIADPRSCSMRRADGARR